jgi:hypothetical protein
MSTTETSVNTDTSNSKCQEVHPDQVPKEIYALREFYNKVYRPGQIKKYNLDNLVCPVETETDGSSGGATVVNNK